MENILEKINKAGLKLLEPITPQETYTVIVNEAMELAGAEYGTILLGQGEDIIRVYASDPFFYQIKIRKDGFVKRAYREKKFFINSGEDVGNVHPVVRKKGIKSVFLIPLSYRGEIIGVLGLHSHRNEHFTQKEVDVLTLFGSMASLAIKRSQLYDETKKALEIRDMFISMAAHELRTPLTSISGYIQLLYSKLGVREGVEGKWMKELYEENKRLMTLVKEILEVNRIKTGQLQFIWQECELTTVVANAILMTKKAYPDRKIMFENKLKEGEDKIIGDSARLTQVFYNVIDNAVKYSSKGSHVEVLLYGKQGMFAIAIVDFGKGIDRKDLPHIFEGHHKGEGGEEGLGIGLYFVESVVRQHRGVIQVRSRLKKGTKVEIKLPKAKYGK